MVSAGTIYDAPPVMPLTGGLYQAATVIDEQDPFRLSMGVLVRTFNCNTGYGLWDIDCGATVNPEKTGDRANDNIYTGTGVWAADECGPKNRDEAIASAQHTLRLQERPLVEGFFGAQLLAATPVPIALANGEPPAFVRAIGQLSAAMKYLPGVVHAPLRFYDQAAHYRQLHGQTSTKTVNGHTWAFSAGYDTILGNSIIITGPVVVHRGPEILSERLEPTLNKRLVVAEREAAVSWECAAVRIEIPAA